MSKVITFSRYFPKYHNRANQPTFFVEKILNSINEYWQNHASSYKYYDTLFSLNQLTDQNKVNCFYNSLNQHNEFKPKHHTIRGGNRWKVGDKFSPRIWSGKPYHSKQIIIAPDIEVKKVWHIEVRKGTDTGGVIYVDGSIYSAIDAMFLYTDNEMCENLKKLANNDGLSSKDLVDWFKFPKPFSGQVISWSDSISY